MFCSHRRASALALPLAVLALLTCAGNAASQSEVVAGVVPDQVGFYVSPTGEVSGSTVPVEVRREWRGDVQVITIIPR